MIAWRGKDNQICKIFFGFTSGAISSGVRELIRFLVQHKLVQVIVTTAAAIEEDIMKCEDSHFLSNFREDDDLLREKGIVRRGNIITSQKGYCAFYEKMKPLLDNMLIKQEKEGINWSPSTIADYWGKTVNNKSSFLFWCHKNNIPVYCPGFTDGALSLIHI